MASSNFIVHLGRLLATCVLVACGGSVDEGAQTTYPPGPGKLQAEGDRTEGARTISEWGLGSPKCTDQEWTYELSQPAYACELAQAAVSTSLPCASLCGEQGATCSVHAGPERNASNRYFDPDVGTCPTTTGFLQCTKTLRDGCALP